MQLLDLPAEVFALIMNELVTTLCPRSYLRKRYVNRRFDAGIVDAIFATGVICLWYNRLSPVSLRFVKRTRGKRNPLVAAYLSWRVKRPRDHSNNQLLHFIDIAAKHLTANGHDKEATVASLCSAALDFCGDQSIVGQLFPPAGISPSTRGEQHYKAHPTFYDNKYFDVALQLAQREFDVEATIAAVKRGLAGDAGMETERMLKKGSESGALRAEAIDTLFDFAAAAAYIGDEQLVRSLAKLKFPLNMRSKFFGTPSLCAARRNHRSLYLFIQRNINPSKAVQTRLLPANNYKCLQNRTLSEWDPLIAASREGNLELVKILHLDILLFEPRSQSSMLRIKDAAYSAACGGSLAIIDMIIGQHPAFLETQTSEQKSDIYSLHFVAQVMRAAVTYGHADIVKAMLERGVSPDLRIPTQQRFMGISILGVAAFSGYTDIVKLLLKYGAQMESGPKDAKFDFSAPLGDAIFGGWVDCIEILIDHGADVNFGDERFPLGIASGTQNLSLVKLLIGHGARLELEGGVRVELVLQYMDDEPNLEVIRILLHEGIIVRNGAQRMSDLDKALEIGHLVPEAVKLLKKFDLDPNHYPFKENFWTESNRTTHTLKMA